MGKKVITSPFGLQFYYTDLEFVREQGLNSCRSKQASRSWKLKLNTRDKYLLCPIPKSGWSSWKRLWHFTAGLISSYDTDVGNGPDTEAGIRDVSSRQLSAEWRKKSYKYSFVFFR